MPDERDMAANKALALAFIDAINRADLKALESLFHEDFVWFTAVIGEDDPNELRPMQSNELRGRNLPHVKPRLNRAEALMVFDSLFKGGGGDAHRAASDRNSHERGDGVASTYDFQVEVLNLFGEGDYLAMEAESHQTNPDNGRYYNNFYCYLFRTRDGKLTLFKEYQDTLHIYDYLAE